ncbi:MAG: IS256 family transposase, partial [Dialister invisus]
MKQVRCLYCGFFCSKYGKTRTGRQRWYCKECHSVFVNPINKTVHDFKHFIQ